MELAVICDDEWYIQEDGVVIGAAVAVILANVWMKRFENIIVINDPSPVAEVQAVG